MANDMNERVQRMAEGQDIPHDNKTLDQLKEGLKTVNQYFEKYPELKKDAGIKKTAPQKDAPEAKGPEKDAEIKFEAEENGVLSW